MLYQTGRQGHGNDTGVPSFFLVTERLGREVVYSPLDLYDGHYHIDFECFSKDIRGCRLLILCNPHNPGGRVWTVEEPASDSGYL